MRTKSITEIDRLTALTNKKLDMIKNLENGLWRDHTQPTGFVKLQDMSINRIHCMMNKSRKIIRYETDAKLRSLEEQIFNLIMGEEHRRSISTQQINIKDNNTMKIAQLTNDVLEYIPSEYKMRQEIEIAGNDGKLKKVKITSITTEVQDSGIMYISYRYKIVGSKNPDNSLLYSETYMMDAQRKARDIKDKEQKKIASQNVKRHFDFSNKKKKETNKEKSIDQKYEEGKTYGPYTIVKAMQAFSKYKKNGILMDSKSLVGYKYVVSMNGEEIKDEYSQTELTARISKYNSQKAAEEAQNKQINLQFDEPCQTNDAVVVNETEININTEGLTPEELSIIKKLVAKQLLVKQ